MGLYKEGEQNLFLRALFQKEKIKLNNGKISCFKKSDETKDESFSRTKDLFKQFKVQIPNEEDTSVNCF